MSHTPHRDFIYMAKDAGLKFSFGSDARNQPEHVKALLTKLQFMKKFSFFLSMGTVILLCSCTHRVSTTINKTYPPLDYREKVVVLDITREEPENAEMLGEIKLGDTGFSIKCGYDLAIEKAKMEARKSGGNVVKIIDHRPPSAFGSTCHRITAKILRVKDVEKLVRAEEGDLLDIDHAIFYVYRPDGRGFLVNYDLYLGDSVICRVSSNYGAKIKTLIISA